MKNLVTGGAGFIGMHLTELLLNRGEKVVVIDDLSTGSQSNIKKYLTNPNFEFYEMNLLSYKNDMDFFTGIDRIYHLAASVGVKYIMEKPLYSLKNNINTTEFVLDLSQFLSSKAVIISSSEVYGISDQYPFSEEDNRVYGPVSSIRWGYAYSKSIDEFMTLEYNREYELNNSVIRLFNTVGPGQSSNYGMVIPRFVKQALTNEPMTVFGSGSQKRCFSHVFDIVKGIYDIMCETNCDGEVINLGSNYEISISDLARKIKKLAKSKSKIINIPYSKAYNNFEDMKKRVPDLNKVIQLIGYKPQYKLNEIIEDVIEYEKL